MRSLILLALLPMGCASTSYGNEACNFSGYSFCLTLPPELKTVSSNEAVDFFVHSFRNEGAGYGIVIYEGNHPDLGRDPEVLNSYEQTLGEVTYSVETVKTEASPYTVLLKRNDIPLPTRIHITTDASGNEETAIGSVLRGLRGCKEIQSVDSRCVAK